MKQGENRADKFKAKILSRETPLAHPANQKEAWPEHDQESPLVSICFDLKPLTQEVINLYK